MKHIRYLLVRQLLEMTRWTSGGPSESAEADVADLIVKGMSSRLFGWELFAQTDAYRCYTEHRNSTRWHCAAGILEADGEGWLLRPSDGERKIRVHPNCHSRLRERSGDVQVVLLYDRKNPDTGPQILVTEAEYHLADPYPFDVDKACMLREYLEELTPAERRILVSFLTDEASRRKTFEAMCRIALKACQMADDLSAEPKMVANDPEEYFLLTIAGFFERDMREDLWLLCVPLAIWELAQMIHTENGERVCKELLRAKACCLCPALPWMVNRILHPGKADAFARMLLSAGEKTAEDGTGEIVRPWLFALLEGGLPLSDPVVREICDGYFDGPMTGEMMHTFRGILTGPNAEVFCKHIEVRYPEKYAQPLNCFPNAMAIVRIWDMHYGPARVLWNAQRLMLGGETEADVLLGIAMMTAHLLMRSEHIRSHRDPVFLSSEQAVSDRVLEWLQDPECLYYPYVCVLAQQLLLHCAVPEAVFANPRVIQAACTAWHKDTCRQNVEKMVSILPLGVKVNRTTEMEAMGSALKARFDEAILGRGEAEELILLFRCCMVLGCCGEDFLRFRFGYLLRKIDGPTIYKSWENREYMRRLKWEMLRLLITSGTGTDSGNDPGAETEEEDKEQEERHLQSFRDWVSRDGADFQELAQAFRCVKPVFREPGMITDWFYALCVLGLAGEAEEFYLRYKAVLDRPCVYLPDHMGLSVERPYHAAACFWNSRTRREKGLELAAGMGHDARNWNLARNCEGDIYRMRCYVPKSGPDRETVMEFFRRQYTDSLLDSWYSHYDDPFITGQTLACPENHSTVLLFGYCGSKPMVLTALEADPSHVYYAAKTLLKDRQVASLAGNNSREYSQMLRSPIDWDGEYCFWRKQ